MTDAVFDFKSINRKLNRQDQKAEYEANNPKEEQSAYGYLYGTPVPFKAPDLRGRVFTGVKTGGTSSAFRLGSGHCETKTILVAELPPYKPSTSPGWSDALDAVLLDWNKAKI